MGILGVGNDPDSGEHFPLSPNDVQGAYCYDKEFFSYIGSEPQVNIQETDLEDYSAAAASTCQWLQKALSSSRNIEMLGSILKDDDDLRIREMTKASQEELEDYFENEGDSYRYQRMLDVSNSHSYLNSVVRASAQAEVCQIQDFNDAEKHVAMTTPNIPQMLAKAGAGLREELQSNLARNKSERERLKPKWWIEWESMRVPFS